jgi:uncharacterized protein YndB with AHSA1/START domain
MSSHIVSVSAMVPAPPAAVFAILVDPLQHPKIDGSGTVRGTIAGPERLSQGAKFGMNMKQGAPYRITSTVVEFEEDRRIAWQHPLGHVWRYALEPAGEGTRVTESFDYSTVGAVRRAFLVVAGFPGKNRKGMEQTLVRLAEVVHSAA